MIVAMDMLARETQFEVSKFPSPPGEGEGEGEAHPFAILNCRRSCAMEAWEVISMT